MLWRRKSEGFEWHKYVRTTIKLRRRDRRRRIARAQQAAVDGLKDAGQAAVEGLKDVGRASAAAGSSGISAAGRIGMVGMQLGFAGLRRLADAAGRIGLMGMRLGLAGLLRLADEVPRLAARTACGILQPAWRWTRLRLAPLAAVIDGSGYVQSLLLFGLVLLSIGVAHASAAGLNANATVAMALALGLFAIGSLPFTIGGRRWPWASEVRQALGWFNRHLPVLSRLPRPESRTLAGGLALAALIGAGWLIVQHAGRIVSLSWLPGFGGDTLQGRASVMSGDTLRLGGRTIRLSGIDAPELDQQCGGQGRERRWRCGAAAQTALQALVRGRTIRCDAPVSERSGHLVATCFLGEKDLAAELVRSGHAFADTGLFSGYARLESTARSAKLGLWRSTVERPSDYRARHWEAAKRTAPDGCPIKGHVTAEGRVYVLPWSPDYARIRVREQRGERWFCSEQEALAAGWRPVNRS
jgi:endonuclease YncB( thermonuclease family)